MRKLLVFFAAVWVGVNLAAAWVSVDRALPHDLTFLDQAGSRDRIGEDWLYGWGTGLTVPMGVVAAVAVLAALAAATGASGRIGAFLLAVLGGASIAFTFADRPATERLRAVENDVTESSLLIASLVLAALLVLVGFTTWLTSPRDRYR